MKRLLALLLFVSMPALASTISGTVTPPGMTVQAYDAAGALKTSATADAAGHYSLTVTSGSYHVLAFDPNGNYATSFYPDAESFETSALVDATNNVTNINLTLVQGGFLAGVVTSTSGAPLPSMTVAAYNADGTRRGFTTTDANGAYHLTVPPGTFDVAAYDNALAYQPDVAHAIVVAAASTTTTDFKLTASAILAGTVTDAATAKPLAAMTVAAYDANGILLATAPTDASGHYRLLLAPASIRIVVFDPAGVYAPFFGASSFDNEQAISLASGATSTVNARLVIAGKFVGHITDASTQAPLSGITVAAFNDDGTKFTSAITDGNGVYTLVVQPSGYRIGAYDTTLQYARRFYPNITTFSSAPHWTAFASQSTTINLALPRGARISGQVSASGSVLPAMTVGAYDAAGQLVTSATTDANGNYAMVVDGGSYALAAFDPAFTYATSTTNIAAVAGQSLGNENFSLVPGAHLSGTVMSNGVKSGSLVPLAGMLAAVYDASGFRAAWAVTRSNGTFDLVAPPGTYTLVAYDPQNVFASMPWSEQLVLTAYERLTYFSFVLQANVVPHRRAARH